MWLYDSIMTGAMRGVDNLFSPDTHPTTRFAPMVLLVAPLALLLFPLQMIAEAEVRLSSQFGL